MLCPSSALVVRRSAVRARAHEAIQVCTRCHDALRLRQRLSCQGLGGGLPFVYMMMWTRLDVALRPRRHRRFRSRLTGAFRPRWCFSGNVPAVFGFCLFSRGGLVCGGEVCTFGAVWAWVYPSMALLHRLGKAAALVYSSSGNLLLSFICVFGCVCRFSFNLSLFCNPRIPWFI